ncbi:MAG: hypothetical protein UY35_C0008G0055 [Candidatus Saccharibacteria bacterium GW2011_GWC2_48_9]|nr:MAG: hypothetical protein UY35_C0008G0055 [Candidatus Saccharibacteria bacterium GW2011_GWC2_48_9]
MAATRKYESNVVQATQQFAHALRWADGNDARLQVLRDAIQSAIDSDSNSPTTFSLRPPTTFNWQPPSWWRTPEQQLERARQLWPNAVLPKQPKEFAPRTKSEVLLLHVPDSFDSLWDKIDAPMGYTKYRWAGVKSDEQNLRLAPNKREFAEPVWLAFDPEYGKGERSEDFWGQDSVAASELLSALIQFPEWSLTWFNGDSAPNLSGYQLKYDGSWSHVPCLRRWGGDRQLGLDARWAVRRGDEWSSPSVRRLAG